MIRSWCHSRRFRAVHTHVPGAFDDEIRGLGSRILPINTPQERPFSYGRRLARLIRTKGHLTSFIATSIRLAESFCERRHVAEFPAGLRTATTTVEIKNASQISSERRTIGRCGDGSLDMQRWGWLAHRLRLHRSMAKPGRETFVGRSCRTGWIFRDLLTRLTAKSCEKNLASLQIVRSSGKWGDSILKKTMSLRSRSCKNSSAVDPIHYLPVGGGPLEARIRQQLEDAGVDLQVPA